MTERLKKLSVIFLWLQVRQGCAVPEKYGMANIQPFVEDEPKTGWILQQFSHQAERSLLFCSDFPCTQCS